MIDWPPFQYYLNGNSNAKYTVPVQMISSATDNGALDLRLYHEIKKEYFEQFLKEGCLRFRSINSIRSIESSRQDMYEMNSSNESSDESRKFGELIAEGVTGLNRSDIGEIWAKINRNRDTESRFHWIHCWSIEKPRARKGYVVLQTTLGDLCTSFQGDIYTENGDLFGGFIVGFIHYMKHEFGNDCIEDLFIKKKCWSWEKEFRVCFHPNEDHELLIRNFLLDNHKKNQDSVFTDQRGIREFLKFKVEISKFSHYVF